jgi:hypothetical protein
MVGTKYQEPREMRKEGPSIWKAEMRKKAPNLQKCSCCEIQTII